MPSIKILLSVAVPPLTNKPSLSPTCCAPGKLLKALVTSPLALGVVTISISVNTAPFFLSLASNEPVLITTAFSSVTNSFNITVTVIFEALIFIFCSYGL